MDALLLSVRDATRLLSLSEPTVWRLILSGDLGSLKVGARRLVPRSEINRFIVERLEKTAFSTDEETASA